MDKRTMKLYFYPMLLLFGLAILGVIIYLLVPTIIGFLFSGDVSCYDCWDYGSGGGSSALQASLCQLCTTTTYFVGTSVMILIILAGVASLLPNLAVTIDLLRSKMPTLHKAFWILAIWFFMGLLASAAYYFMVKKD